ncbi:MAG: Arc family DNA-binding protein [Candidatus Hydrogenedentes bacterium]|nr:Arc family DNA-binding protein [Candidatus Hydrogenedentota bacterium]
MSEDPRIQYKFMIPASMKQRLEDAAHENRRSLSAEIISRLETTLEMDAYVPKANAHPEEPPSLRELIERMNDLQRQIMDYTKNIR